MLRYSQKLKLIDMNVLSNTPSYRVQSLIEGQRSFYATGATKSKDFRKEWLRCLYAGLHKWEKPLCDALWKDLHKSYEEAYMTEIGLIYGEIKDAIKHLEGWMKKRRKASPLSVFPSSSYIVREPLGCSLIVAPWNYPVQLLLNPLVGAISAGCTAILKPSPYVPNVAITLEQFVLYTFDEHLVAVVQGDRTVNTDLFSRRFDIVFFTGSPALGKVVMKAQAPFLTPLVLELGGKSPCVVDKDADISIAARRIAWGKCLNSGQTCIAPDYLFLHEDIKKDFIDAFKDELGRLYPDGTEGSRHYVHIVRDAAFERLKGYLNDGRNIRTDIPDTYIQGLSPSPDWRDSSETKSKEMTIILNERYHD